MSCIIWTSLGTVLGLVLGIILLVGGIAAVVWGVIEFIGKITSAGFLNLNKSPKQTRKQKRQSTKK